jgi:hypothetical protein
MQKDKTVCVGYQIIKASGLVRSLLFQIKITGMLRANFRLRLSVLFFKLAAFIAGSDIEIELEYKEKDANNTK